MRMSKQHIKIQPQERDLIALWIARSISKREIARRLNRSDSSIRAEIARNSFNGHYVAIHAQALTNKRSVSAKQRHSLKNKSVYKYVMKKLRSGWSPEQIAGRLRLKHPNNPYWYIHHETIYRFIYNRDNKEKKLWEYLPRKHKKRRIKFGRSTRRSRIPDTVSIHERPEEIEGRLVFGHWEGDSVVGKYHKSGIHTEVERKTRFLKAKLIRDFTGKETQRAQHQIFNQLPTKAKKSTTVDNGKEFTNHKQFNLPVYFCDPYSSWQKATNENTNGLIRRYLPKKTDFRGITQQELDDIVEEINNRPRKCLGYNTPKEIFEKEILITGERIPSRM